MYRPRHWIFCVGCAAGLFVTGCGNSRDEADVEEADLTEFAAETNPASAQPPPSGEVAQGATAATPPPASTQPAGPPAPTPPPTAPVGLIKTVTQQLRQQTPDGWTESRSTLELTFLLTPDEARPLTSGDPRGGQQRFQVKYQRVRVMQEAAGEQPLLYDSNAAPNPMPPAFLPYHTMNKDGFEFWLDKDRQLVDVVGFEQFLERCLQPVPAEERAAARAALPAASPLEGMSCFVDDTVGLIPPEATQPGSTWMRSRQLAQPVAMTTTTRYTLQPYTPEKSDVDISGTIAPLAGQYSAGAGPNGIQVNVRGGQIIGKCRIDRRSGIPLGSKVEQLLEMTVHLPGGGEFDQFKITTTTVENPGDRTVLPQLTLSAALPVPSYSNPAPRVDSGIDGEARRR